MTWYIHINKNVKQANAKHGELEPVIRYQKGKYGKPKYAPSHRLRFKEGEILYQPDGDPILPCGARLVIATEEEPTIIE